MSVTRTLRFVHQYLRRPADRVETVETKYRRGELVLPATVYRPATRQRPLPGWVLLHGLTATGRGHASLVPFASALAASGSVVLVPEVPEWVSLRVASGVTGPTIAGAARALEGTGAVAEGRIGTIGFSFGATQALVAAATDPAVRERVRAIAAWGGYCELDRLFVFGFNGEHELDGVTYRDQPDPYGRWIMAGNYLTGIPGYEDRTAVASALMDLANAAGRLGAYAGAPEYDPIKRALRERLAPADRPLFDLMAPPAGQDPPPSEENRALALELSAAAKRADPLLDAAGHMSGVTIRTLIAHGREDRLVPFTEAYRVRRTIPPEACESCTITSLFAHSAGTRGLRATGYAREGARFVALLHRILRLV